MKIAPVIVLKVKRNVEDLKISYSHGGHGQDSLLKVFQI